MAPGSRIAPVEPSPMCRSLIRTSMSQSLGNAAGAGKERGCPNSLGKSARGYAEREDCSVKRGYADEGKLARASNARVQSQRSTVQSRSGYRRQDLNNLGL